MSGRSTPTSLNGPAFGPACGGAPPSTSSSTEDGRIAPKSSSPGPAAATPSSGSPPAPASRPANGRSSRLHRARPGAGRTPALHRGGPGVGAHCRSSDLRPRQAPARDLGRLARSAPRLSMPGRMVATAGCLTGSCRRAEQPDLHVTAPEPRPGDRVPNGGSACSRPHSRSRSVLPRTAVARCRLSPSAVGGAGVAASPTWRRRCRRMSWPQPPDTAGPDAAAGIRPGPGWPPRPGPRTPDRLREATRACLPAAATADHAAEQ